MSLEVPRRCHMEKWAPAEKAIKRALSEVESCGAHPLLTDAVVLLDQAFSKVADYVDGMLAKTPPVLGDKSRTLEERVELLERLVSDLTA